MARQVYVFRAQLEGWRGVRRTIAIRTDQAFIELHYALQEAFEWGDDHLFAFWPGGEFWPPRGTEYTHPLHLALDPFADWDLPRSGPERKSAERRLDRARLSRGDKIAYLFDFGDEWRVRLTLREVIADDGGPYPRLLESVGDAPPQYPDYDEDEADAA
jgi:Plasmid pRiA4b ORF-3-like protein